MINQQEELGFKDSNPRQGNMKDKYTRKKNEERAEILFKWESNYGLKINFPMSVR